MASIPKVIKNFNLFVDGSGFAGLCDSVQLPEFSVMTEDHRAGGMDAPLPIDLGMNLLDLTFTMAEWSPVIFRQFGLINQSAVQCTFRAAMVDDEAVWPMVVHARGMYRTVSPQEVSNAQKNTLQASLGLRYIRVIMNGEDLIEIDIPNMVRRINGSDQLAAMRQAVAG